MDHSLPSLAPGGSIDGKSLGRGAGGQAEAVRVGWNPLLVPGSCLEMGTRSLHTLKSLST